MAATARKEKAGGPADAIVEAQDMRHRSSGPITSRRKTAIEADKEADARARLVSVNVKHGRPRPAKAVMRVSRATLLAHSPETTHDARTGRRCLTPRRIWRQAVKGDKHGA